MKSVALHNLGCKVNSYELDGMQQMLQENGYKIVSFDEIADIYLINTCSVTNMADRKSRQMLHRAKRMNPDAIIVAMGCYVQTGGKEVLLDPAIDLVVGNNKKKDIVTILALYFEEKEKGHIADKTLADRTVIDINHTAEYEEMHISKTADHTRAYIKVQDGCNQFCSYCIIPYARGRVRSRHMDEIISEVKGLVNSGYQEIVLTGIHISSYGIDMENVTLLMLLKNLHQIKELKRIRLGSLEPRIITEEFVAEISRLPKICPHFHLSLQSGSDTVLRRMNRHYLTSEYFEKVQLLRTQLLHPAITTDVIVGFPGESEEEFLETKQFLKQLNFYEMHIFKYSKRRGTRAAAMEDQVKEEIKTVRSNELLRLEKQQSKQFREYYIGKEVTVLLEEPKTIDGKTYMIGHTQEYVKIAVESHEMDSNKMVTGKAISFLTNDILLLSIEF